MQVEAQVWYWTSQGMRRNPSGPRMLANGYVTLSEAARLAEEAHTRGFNDAKNRAIEFIANTGK